MGTHSWGDREVEHSKNSLPQAPGSSPGLLLLPHLHPHPCFLSWLKASGLIQGSRLLSSHQLFLFPWAHLPSIMCPVSSLTISLLIATADLKEGEKVAGQRERRDIPRPGKSLWMGGTEARSEPGLWAGGEPPKDLKPQGACSALLPDIQALPFRFTLRTTVRIIFLK